VQPASIKAKAVPSRGKLGGLDTKPRKALDNNQLPATINVDMRGRYLDKTAKSDMGTFANCKMRKRELNKIASGKGSRYESKRPDAAMKGQPRTVGSTRSELPPTKSASRTETWRHRMHNRMRQEGIPNAAGNIAYLHSHKFRSPRRSKASSRWQETGKGRPLDSSFEPKGRLKIAGMTKRRDSGNDRI